jgi:hypothetical protein
VTVVSQQLAEPHCGEPLLPAVNEPRDAQRAAAASATSSFAGVARGGAGERRGTRTTLARTWRRMVVVRETQLPRDIADRDALGQPCDESRDDLGAERRHEV